MEVEILISKIEKSLEVNFNDEELKGLKSLSDLENLARRKVNFGFENENKCLSSYVFYKLKRSFPDQRVLKPSQKLATLFTKSNRIKEYRNLSTKLGYNLPRLHTNSVLVNLFVLSFILTIVTPFIQEKITGLSISFCIVLLISWLLMKVTSQGINKKHSVRDFVSIIVATNYMKIAREIHSYNLNDISKLITVIIADETDFSPSDIKMEFSFKELEMM